MISLTEKTVSTVEEARVEFAKTQLSMHVHDSEKRAKLEAQLEKLMVTWEVEDGHCEGTVFNFDLLVLYKGMICPLKTTAAYCCLNPIKADDGNLYLSASSIGPTLTKKQMNYFGQWAEEIHLLARKEHDYIYEGLLRLQKCAESEDLVARAKAFGDDIAKAVQNSCSEQELKAMLKDLYSKDSTKNLLESRTLTMALEIAEDEEDFIDYFCLLGDGSVPYYNLGEPDAIASVRHFIEQCKELGLLNCVKYWELILERAELAGVKIPAISEVAE